MTILPSESAEPSVDYDFAPVVQLEANGIEYRVDAGFRGVIAVSSREAGSWSWSLLAEGKWDGVRLKAKAVDREIVLALEKALRVASEEPA
jgi:hypothetical protein